MVAHKTGSSGVNKQGQTAVVNDIGVSCFYLAGSILVSVFVTDSKESTETNEKIIAGILPGQPGRISTLRLNKE
ncbi:MAG: hypothetical protein U0Z17_08300 [Bacteroidales bacterium]